MILQIYGIEDIMYEEDPKIYTIRAKEIHLTVLETNNGIETSFFTKGNAIFIYTVPVIDIILVTEDD